MKKIFAVLMIMAVMLTGCNSNLARSNPFDPVNTVTYTAKMPMCGAAGGVYIPGFNPNGPKPEVLIVTVCDENYTKEWLTIEQMPGYTIEYTVDYILIVPHISGTKFAGCSIKVIMSK